MAGTTWRMGGVEWLLLVALGLLWGWTYFFGKLALAEVGPLTLVLGRVGVAALALDLCVFMAGHRLPRTLRAWGAFALLGALNNLIPFSLIFWGQTRIASGLAAILNASTPLFTAVLAHLLTRDERLTPGRLAGVLLGLGGVALMVGPAALAGLGREVTAQLAVLAGAASFALAGIFGRRFRHLPPLVTAAGQVSASSVMALPIALAVERPWGRTPPGLVTWGALLGLGLACTALAYVLYFRILATAGATNLLLVTLLIPVSAVLLGTALLGEPLEPGHVAGMALIGAGLAAIDGRPLALAWARLRRASVAARAVLR